VKLYLVDGTFEIFRCFHGAPRAKNADGDEVGAARGLFHTMASLLREDGLTHVAIAFDSVVSRVDARDTSDSALLRSQYPFAADIGRALGITIWPMSRYQADDAIATAARRFAADPRIDQVVICSSDNDFAQCVEGRRITIWNRVTKARLDEDGVRMKFGVSPAVIPEYLALVGDPSDGIPGIPGFGPKAAAAILNRFGGIDEIPADHEKWGVPIRNRPSLAAMLSERRREALLYRDLSTLRTDVPLPDALDDLEWHGADREKVEDVARRLDDAELLKRTIRYR